MRVPGSGDHGRRPVAVAAAAARQLHTADVRTGPRDAAGERSLRPPSPDRQGLRRTARLLGA